MEIRLLIEWNEETGKYFLYNSEDEYKTPLAEAYTVEELLENYEEE